MNKLFAAAKLLQPCLTLCDPTDSNTPGSSVPGILQARTLEWVAIAFSLNKEFSHIQIGKSREHKPSWNHLVCCCLVTKLCLTLCDPRACSPPGPSVHGISQARILEWAAISFSRGSSQPRDQTPVSCIGMNWQAVSLALSRQGTRMASIMSFKLSYTDIFWTLRILLILLTFSLNNNVH